MEFVVDAGSRAPGSKGNGLRVSEWGIAPKRDMFMDTALEGST